MITIGSSKNTREPLSQNLNLFRELIIITKTTTTTTTTTTTIIIIVTTTIIKIT